MGDDMDTMDALNVIFRESHATLMRELSEARYALDRREALQNTTHVRMGDSAEITYNFRTGGTAGLNGYNPTWVYVDEAHDNEPLDLLRFWSQL